MKCGTFRKGCEMRNNQKSKSSAGTLRQQAEQRLATLPMGEPPLRPDDYERVFYELRVHKIELEIQNEELRRTQTELEVRRALYFDLYDLAPVSYCTLSAQGLILEANLTVATLLGLPRGELVGRILSKFMFEPDVEVYYRHHRQLLATREPQDYELHMRHAQGSLVWVRVGATVAEDAQGRTVSHIVLSDISGRKVEEEALRVSEVAQMLYASVQPTAGRDAQRELHWACALHELGMMVSHHDHHRHSAYVLGHVDAPGFSQSQQRRLAELVLAQRGGLRKVESSLMQPDFAWQAMCLRLAIIKCHARGPIDSHAIALRRTGNTATLSWQPSWHEKHPHTHYLLNEEVIAWQRSAILQLELPRAPGL